MSLQTYPRQSSKAFFRYSKNCPSDNHFAHRKFSGLSHVYLQKSFQAEAFQKNLEKKTKRDHDRHRNNPKLQS